MISGRGRRRRIGETEGKFGGDFDGKSGQVRLKKKKGNKKVDFDVGI